MRLTNFWETLDLLADASLPEVDWRGGHQKEWPFIKPLLKATGKTASSISCPSPSGPNCPRRVVELDDGQLVAECQDTLTGCTRRDLTAQCVAIDKLDRGKFAAMVCKALDLAVSTKKAGTDGVFHVGDRQVAAGRGVPVFALFQGGSQPEKSVVALEALEKFASPRLLLVPTSQTLSSDQKTYLGRTGTTHMAFDDAIYCDDAHVAQAYDAASQLLERLVAEFSQTLKGVPTGAPWLLPPTATWEQVTLEFREQQEIEARCPGSKPRRLTPQDLNLWDAQSGRPKASWETLIAIPANGGFLKPMKRKQSVDAFKQNKKQLKEALGRIIQIPGDPFKYDRQTKSYRARFIVRTDALRQGREDQNQ